MEIQNGKTYRIKSGIFKDQEYVVEDLCEKVLGRSWMVANGNPACLDYAIRSALENLPTDNNVYYGKMGMFGKLIHESQIGEKVTVPEAHHSS